MEVRLGYKRTEVGVIPDEWEVKCFGDLCSILRGGSPRPIQNYITDRADGINWIKIGDVGVGAKYIDTTEEKIIPAGVARSRYVNVGDFLLSNSMSYGRPYILRTEGCIHDGWLVIQDYQGDFDTEYLYYYMSSEVVITQYMRYAAGSSVHNLNKDIVSNTRVSVPPLPEQRAIAAALSDVDALITALEKLIAKKRDLKQAAMQQLLTGKTRLPGYSGEWEEKRLGSLLKIEKGELITENAVIKGNIPVIAGGKKPAYFHNKANRFGKTITISGSGANAGYVSMYTSPIYASDCSTISEGDNYYIDYVYYYLKLKQEEIYRSQTGGAQPHIHPHNLRPLNICIPEYNEQVAIAKVLLDIDEDIEIFEKRLAKTRALKQGIMQELLTGKTRLV